MVVIIAAFFLLRDIYLFNRRQARVNATFVETQKEHEKEILRIKHETEGFREFKKEMRTDHEEFRSIFQEIRYSLKDLTKEVTKLQQLHTDMAEVKDTLKDINYRFKENDLRHDGHDKNFKRLESQINPESPPKSKQA